MKVLTFISVVAYVYNDESTVASFLVQLDRFFQERLETYEFILVNDASTDNTVSAAFTVKDEIHGNVSIVNLQGRHGRERALDAGTDLAIGDFIFELDKLAAAPQAGDFMAMYTTAVNKSTDVVLGRKIRLVTRRALYALADSKGSTRTERCKNCGFDWVAVSRQYHRPRLSFETLLTKASYEKLLFALAIVGLSGGAILALFPKTRGTAPLLAGFALVQLGLAWLNQRIEKRSRGRDDYKVKEIIRINRY